MAYVYNENHTTKKNGLLFFVFSDDCGLTPSPLETLLGNNFT